MPVCPDGNSDDASPDAPPGPRRSPRSKSAPQAADAHQLPPFHTIQAKRERLHSLTPTILNDEITKGEETDEAGGMGMLSMSSIPLQQTSSFLTFTHAFGLDKPLASLFVSPKSRVNTVRRLAGEQGMFSGAVYKPRTIKEEESERWVVMGADAAAVDRVLDSQRKEVDRQLHLECRMPGGGTQILLEKEKNGQRVGILQFILASAIGGFVVFYCLSRI